MNFKIEESFKLIKDCNSYIKVLNDKKKLKDEFIYVPFNEVYSTHIKNIKPAIDNSISESIITIDKLYLCPKCKKELDGLFGKNQNMNYHYCKYCGKHIKDIKNG